MPTLDEVIMFAREQSGFRGPMTEATSLQCDLGIYGDDMDEFLTTYARRFGVDLSGYLWYFHTGEEGFSIGALFYPPPNARVREIPITIAMLRQFAEHGHWAVQYPEHEAPRSRPDIRINQCLVLGLIAALLIVALRGCLS